MQAKAVFNRVIRKISEGYPSSEKSLVPSRLEFVLARLLLCCGRYDVTVPEHAEAGHVITFAVPGSRNSLALAHSHDLSKKQVKKTY